MTAIGIYPRRPGSASSFEEKKTTVASLRMRKHRYAVLAFEEANRRAEEALVKARAVSRARRVASNVLADPATEPLRRKFRGPGRHSVWDYIEARVALILRLSRSSKVEAGFSVESLVTKRLMQILYTICDSTTVYPHISPDGENGISAVWYAEKYALELLVDCDVDATAIIHVDGYIKSMDLEEGDSAALRAIRGHLGTLSFYVKTRNPHWRQLIAE